MSFDRSITCERFCRCMVGFCSVGVDLLGVNESDNDAETDRRQAASDRAKRLRRRRFGTRLLRSSIVRLSTIDSRDRIRTNM
jgi:hypothetical protein